MLLAGCASRTPSPIVAEPVPPLSADAWRQVKEEIWIASTLAQSEAEIYARQAMQDWMGRVRERIDKEYVPWYSGYWTQQWIGLKAGWFELSRSDDEEESVEKYLARYLQENFYEIVLVPAGAEADPQAITERAADLYVKLLSMQLRRLPKTYAVEPRSLRESLRSIPLITLPGIPAGRAALSEVFDRDNLNEMSAYEALIFRANSVGSPEASSPNQQHLQVVTEDAVARRLAELPVRAGGGAAATVVGEALGLFISAGMAAWSAIKHDQEKPVMESQLKEVLEVGLKDVWQILMEDPELGVLFPVNHMTQQIETELFPAHTPYPLMPF